MKIDEIDEEILRLIAKRLDLMPAVAQKKKEKGLGVTDTVREEEMLKKRAELLKSLGYDDPDFVKELFSVVIKKSKEVQR